MPAVGSTENDRSDLNAFKTTRARGRSRANFYTELPTFTDFRKVTQWDAFAAVPHDWYVVICDVKGSTQAIDRGRYKDVNTVGAASISCALEVLKEDIPYIFGGDGATLLVPPWAIDEVLDALLKLERLSALQFGLELRVGRIQVGEVVSKDNLIEVARHELYAGRCMAVIRGGGVTLAEKLIKGDEARYCVRDENSGDTALKGLSCRWRPVPSKHGRIVSILVSARGSDPNRVYEEFMRALDQIFEDGIDQANPINLDQLSYKSIGECIADERRYHTRRVAPSFFARLCEIVLAVLVFKYNVNPVVINPQRYKQSMRLHSDFRKFDDTLRMVVDCTRYQILAIRDYLLRGEKRGDLWFGIHESDTALMTCYVRSVNDGDHIHFIDGGDGGYAMAAKRLKAKAAGGA